MYRKKINKAAESVRMSKQVFTQIKESIGQYKAETGGILMFNKQGEIEDFVFDEDGDCSAGAYDPGIEFLNPIIKEKEATGLHYYGGSVHSHPRGIRSLSGDWGNNIGDMGAIRANLDCNPELEKFVAIIVFSTYDKGDFEIIPYIVYRDNPYVAFSAGLELFDSKNKDNEVPKTTSSLNTSRLTGGIDLEMMKESRIVVIGIGGANTLVEDLVRCNAGSIIAIDPDIVEDHNLASQGWYNDEIGQSKVSVLGRRLKRINPALNYQGIPDLIQDLNKSDIEKILEDADIILGMTDNFRAQDFIHQMSMKYSIPAVFAMAYHRGVAAEITFNIPGEIPVNHRDAVIERYEEFEKNPAENGEGSQGGTIMAAKYLNACLGHIILGILHRNLPGYPFSRMFHDNWHRNFIQVRLHPDYSNKPDNMFYNAMRSNEGAYFFDSIWRKVEPVLS